MNHGIYTAAAGAIANDRKFDIISNNLANANTTGFKKSKVSFASMLPLKDEEADIIKVNNNDPENIRKGVFNTFPFINIVKTDFSQGYIKETGNDLDFAISGNGFFAVKDSQGNIKFTRDGSFTLKSNGTLVNQNGENVLDSNLNTIQIPTQNVKFLNVDEAGNIYVNDNFIAKLAVKDINDKTQFQKAGANEYMVKDMNIVQDSKDFSVYQGYLEGSNINIVKEMTSLIQLMRSYEATQKVITTIDTQLDQKAANDVGRII